MAQSDHAFVGAKPLKKGVFLRVTVSAVVMSVALGACSSVPDAVNPVSWYEKTTDFFSGDDQAAQSGNTASAPSQNQGLSADPDAPPPAPPTPRENVEVAQGGLSGDQNMSGNYATPPIARQGAATNVLTPSGTTASSAPPAPVAAPQVAVEPAPTNRTSSASAMAPQPSQQPSAPPAPPSMTAQSGTTPLSERPNILDGAPAPFQFPAVGSDPFAGDFETVVISADGMETENQPAPRRYRDDSQPEYSAPSASSSAMFPQPGATTTGQAGPATVGGMTRVATIHFANNSAALDQRDRSILGAVIQLQRERGGRVVVVGHASSRTNDMDFIKHQMVNFEISMERASSIGTQLTTMGLSENALEIQAVADTQPLFLEVMPSGEAGNRRVEIYLAGAAT